MVTWREFAGARPDLAEAGRTLLYQYGVGLAFVATVRPDGGPRLHPVCPVLLAEEGLYALLVPSPKREDLRRDPRYAMHSFPCEQNEDAFYVVGTTRPSDDPSLRRMVGAQFLTEREWDAPPPGFDQQELFEFDVERCLYTRTGGHGDSNPEHTIWHAP